MEIVKVRWVDACDEGFMVLSYVPKCKPYITESVGFLGYEDDECISIIAEIETIRVCYGRCDIHTVHIK